MPKLQIDGEHVADIPDDIAEELKELARQYGAASEQASTDGAGWPGGVRAEPRRRLPVVKRIALNLDFIVQPRKG